MKVIELGIYAEGRNQTAFEISGPCDVEHILEALDKFPRIDFPKEIKARSFEGFPPAIQNLMKEDLANTQALFTVTLKEKSGPIGSDNREDHVSSVHTDNIWVRFTLEGKLFCFGNSPFQTKPKSDARRQFAKAIHELASGKRPCPALTRESALSAVDKMIADGAADLALRVERIRQKPSAN
jgi:hypothetical protein